MSKRKLNFDEASLTTAIKGYLGGRRVLDPYERLRKKDKKKDVPWYLKRSSELEDMVRRDLGERKLEAAINILFEAKLPGLTLDKLPSELRDSILKLVVGPRKVSGSWHRWEALPDELQKRIESWYEKNKDEFQKRPEQPRRVSRAAVGKKPEKKRSKPEEPLRKRVKMGGMDLPAPEEPEFKAPGREITSADEYLKSLEVQLKQAQEKLKKHPKDYMSQRRIKFLRSRIASVERAIEKGEDFRKYVTPVPGAVPGTRVGEKPPELGKILPPKEKEKTSLHKSDIPELGPLLQKIEKYTASDSVDKETKRPLGIAIERLKKVAGLTPSTPSEHKRLTSWAQNVIIGKFGGNIIQWAKTQPVAPRPRRVAPPKSKMKVRQGGKKIAPTAATKQAQFRREPMPGAKPSLMKLHRAAEQDPEHKRIPFAPEPLSVTGRGPTAVFEPGAVGRILQKLYGELATEYLYGKGGHFDDLLAAVNERHPEVDLRDVLNRYIEIQSGGDDEKLSPEEEAQVMDEFSPEEGKALGELAKLSDPEVLQAIKYEDMTKFEKALGPVLRKHYAKKGHVIDPEVGYSRAMRLQLSRNLGVSLQDVEKVMQEKPPQEREHIESIALQNLKVISPDIYDKEMRMRKKREKAKQYAELEKQSRTPYVEFKPREKGASIPAIQREIKQTKIEIKFLDRDIKHAERKGDSDALEELYGEYRKQQRKLDVLERALSKAEEFPQVISPEREAEVERRRHLVPRGGGGLSKAERRARGRAEEPRDPEELARKQAMSYFPDPSLPEKPRRVYRSVEDYEKDQKKKKLIDLIKQSRAKSGTRQMAANESFNFSIAELFEGFENSYDLDVPTKEEEWEEAKIPAQKDWQKDLTLESLVARIMEK